MAKRPPKRKAGRPPELDDPAKRAVLFSWLEQGAPILHAARAAGVSKQTVYNTRDRDPEFAEQMDQATEYCNGLVERALYARALQGEPWAVRMWLHNRDRDRWSSSPTIPLPGEDDEGGAPTVLRVDLVRGVTADGELATGDPKTTTKSKAKRKTTRRRRKQRG